MHACIHTPVCLVAVQTFGTVTHMPPELLMEGKLTYAADVFAFGVLLWSMFTSLRPWQGLQRTQVRPQSAPAPASTACYWPLTTTSLVGITALTVHSLLALHVKRQEHGLMVWDT